MDGDGGGPVAGMPGATESRLDIKQRTVETGKSNPVEQAACATTAEVPDPETVWHEQDCDQVAGHRHELRFGSSVALSAGFLKNMTAGKGSIALVALIFGLLDAVSIRMQGRTLPIIGDVPVPLIQALAYIP